jgi:hypothetical protein
MQDGIVTLHCGIYPKQQLYEVELMIDTWRRNFAWPLHSTALILHHVTMPGPDLHKVQLSQAFRSVEESLRPDPCVDISLTVSKSITQGKAAK